MQSSLSHIIQNKKNNGAPFHNGTPKQITNLKQNNYNMKTKIE